MRRMSDKAYPPIFIPQGNLKYLLLSSGAPSIVRESWFLRKFLFNRFPKSFLYEKAIAWEARLFPHKIRKGALSRIQSYFEEIEPYLPETASRVLDIAAGQGLVDVLLFRHFKNPELAFHLVDKFTLAPKVTFGFQHDAPGYASAVDARELMQINGIKNVTTHIATTNTIDSSLPFDVVISRAGWGFMFPIDTYLEHVHALTRPGGIVITDLRKGVPEAEGQEDALRKKFGNLAVIAEWKKGKRVLLRKQS
jgi:SAM-dependent methyltransferase